jgi:predicted pPIWI-associating nuclease
MEIFEVTEEVRAEIISRIEGHLYDEAIGAFINETIDSLDLIAGRYETGGILYDKMRVLSIDGVTLHYEITGSVDVTLHYGSGADAATIEERLSFCLHDSRFHRRAAQAPLEPNRDEGRHELMARGAGGG